MSSNLKAQYVYVVDGNGKNLSSGQILQGKPSTVRVDIVGNKIVIDNHNCVEIPMDDPNVRCIQDMDATKITGRQTLYYYTNKGEMKRAVLFGKVPVINEMYISTNHSYSQSNSNNSNFDAYSNHNNGSLQKQNRKKCLYTGPNDKSHCGGDGKCSLCGGDGLMNGFGLNNVKCSMCNGTGKCVSCNGTGYIIK